MRRSRGRRHRDRNGDDAGGRGGRDARAAAPRPARPGAGVPGTGTVTMPAAGGSGTLGQRIRAQLVAAAARLLIVLPEGPVNALGEASGELWYRFAPGRAARARRNL